MQSTVATRILCPKESATFTLSLFVVGWLRAVVSGTMNGEDNGDPPKKKTKKGLKKLLTLKFWFPWRGHHNESPQPQMGPKKKSLGQMAPDLQSVPRKSHSNQVPPAKGLPMPISPTSPEVKHAKRHQNKPSSPPKSPEPHHRNPFHPCPIVEPQSVEVDLPIEHTGEDVCVIHMHNPGDEHFTYKVKGTKLKWFKVSPIHGWLEPHEESVVKVVTRDCSNLQHNDHDYNEFDHFTVVMAPVPVNHMDHDIAASKLWQLKPRPTKLFHTRIEWVRHEQDQPSRSAVESTVATATDRDTSMTLGGRCTTDPTIDPEEIIVDVPNDGSADHVTLIHIHNNFEKDTIAYKLKCTNLTRFKFQPAMGLIFGGQECTVRMLTNKLSIDDEDGYDPYEHLSILVTHDIPQTHTTNARKIWASKPEVQFSRHLPIRYQMQGVPSQFHKMKIARGPNGFYLKPA